MKLEGIHHITAITAEAQPNVDFYAGTLGLRMVKKTVNQDAPSVYHLFYADEQGSPGSDITFFEFRGAPRGRAGAGMVHRIVWRVASTEALDFWERAARRRRHRDRPRRRAPALRRPRGPRARARRRPGPRPAADRRPPRGPGRARAAGLSRRPRLRGGPRAQRRPARAPRVRALRRRLGGARRVPRRALGLRRAARRAGDRGRRHGPPHRLGVGDGRAHRVARARDRRRGAADPGDRPLLVPLDLLPRAERSAVRDRDPRPGIRRRRGSRAPRARS